MQKFLVATSLFFLAFIADAQQLSQLRLSQGSTLNFIGFMTDQGVLIRMSDDGRILEYGMEVKSPRYDFYAPQLQPFTGRIDYYGAEADSLSKGKIKSIGTCAITYYGPLETEERRGKVRTLGTLLFDYFPQYEHVSLKGKMKSAGSVIFSFYGPFENEAYRGKLKSIGNNTLTYHSSFDDKMVRGKIKSAGSTNFTWNTSLDPGNIGGTLKNGNYRQTVAGVTYILN